MTKYLFLFILLLAGTKSAVAQYVSIPDSNFRAALMVKYPSCFSGTLLDTTCAGILTARSLNIENKNISSIEGARYFKNIDSLLCKKNKLTSLPVLPKSLKYLNCNENQLASLVIPDSLKYLWCSKNKLTVLPALPGTLLELLCDHNFLTSIPALPSKLYALWCAKNNLTSLPAFPPAFNSWLDCTYNPALTCLPPLGDTILVCTVVDGTQIKCISNRIYAYNGDVNTLPVCTNPEDICPVLPLVSGKVYNDLNNNGSYNPPTEPVLPGFMIKTNPGSWVTSTDSNGVYWLRLDSMVNNTWSIINSPYIISNPATRSLVPPNNGVQPGSFDFGVRVKPNIRDLEIAVGSTRLRPGFGAQIRLTATNAGTVDQNSITVKLKKPAGFALSSTTPVYSAINNDTIMWNNVSLSTFSKKTFDVNLTVPTDQLGNIIDLEGWIIGSAGDSTPLNNYAVLRETVTGSFDPNDKNVNRTILPPTYNADTDRLLYTIRFQNTGTDTAFTVIVRDEIPEYLEMSSLKVVNSSHSYQLSVREKHIVEVTFPNIQLPDSNINEAASHGFVQLSFKPISGLVMGEEIKNSASIYFDYNEPVITNEAITTVNIISGIASNKKLDFKVFPNPAGHTARVELPSEMAGIWKLFDVTGKDVLSGKINNLSAFDLTVDKLIPGIYFLSLIVEKESSTVQIQVFHK